MKKYILPLLLLLLLISSCEKDNNKAGTLTISVETPQTRTVSPDKSNMKIDKYVLKGLSVGAISVEETFKEQTKTLQLLPGYWSFYVDAYDSKNHLVAKSDSQKIRIEEYQDVEATFQLNPIFDGNGTFNFKLGIPTKVIFMDKILCTLTSAEGTLSEIKFEFDYSKDGTEDGEYKLFTKVFDSIPAGSYNLKVETTNKRGDVYGIPLNESVIILTGQETSFEHIWDMAYFPLTDIDVNNNAEYICGNRLYISGYTSDDHVYLSIDDGEWTEITSEIKDNCYYIKNAKWKNQIRISIKPNFWVREKRINSELKTTGPAGGYVFYDCDADNNSGNANGLISSECGWRYLEAAPSDIGSYVFGYYKPNGSIVLVGTSAGIGDGKKNTENLVKKMDIDGKAYLYSGGGSSTAEYAAKKCLDYSLKVDGKIYDDWFLPSKDELSLMYINLKENGLGSFDAFDYWSSSEYLNGLNAWRRDFRNGHQDDYSRGNETYVRPIRAFLSI